MICEHGFCRVDNLAKACKISNSSASKAILWAQVGLIPPSINRGHHRKGVGSIVGFTIEHHIYIYKLYLWNPSRPLLGYIERFHNKYNINLSESFVSGWFKHRGPFKGTMRLTSKFPPAKDSWECCELVHQYFMFMSSVDHRNVVFGDEKPFKEIEIFDRVRRDPITGIVPALVCNANSKNRYNIFSAISLKKDIPICSRVIEENGDAVMFCQFVF